MPFEMHKKEFAPRKRTSRAHTPISRAHAPLTRRTDALISPGGNSCPGLNRTGGRESIPSISTLFRGGFDLFLFDGRVTELSEVRDPIIPALVSGYPETSVVVSGTERVVMGVRPSLTALHDILYV